MVARVWADNETAIDLLGFEYLVDQLEVVLTDPRLRPVTVGALGDWGSGKTSLMFMTAERLRARDGYGVVTFSPWRYESTEEVKAQLMSSVLRELGRWIDKLGPEDATSAAAAKDQLKKLVGLLRTTVGHSGVALGTLGAAAAGLPSELGGVVGGIAAATIMPGQSADDGAQEDPIEFASATEFRDELRELMQSIGGLEALVVLIDDVDRCLPTTIIETFETIRLFLHVPNTSFVIAAHPQIVEAAVAHRYAGSREGDANLGRDYLEKLIQLPIIVPPLSRTEVESYINLLFCELYTDDAKYVELRQLAATRRSTEPLGVAMNYGIAAEVFEQGRVPDTLAAAFDLNNKIGPILGEGLRGNPRQVKRFLNTFQLRLITAEKRSTKLDPAVLAKLMILELERDEFQQLFEWQITQDGDPSELRDAELLVRDASEPAAMSAEAAAWAARPAVERWLRLDPPLAGTPLGTYFFYSRDRLSPVAAGARLTSALQELLARLQLDVTAQRSAAVKDVVGLGGLDRIAVYRALLERAARHPGGPAMRSALDVAVLAPDVLADFGAALQNLPPNSVPAGLPALIVAAFSKNTPPAVTAALDVWQATGNKKVQTAVNVARTA